MSGQPDKITFRLSEGKDGVPVNKLITQLKVFLRALIELDIQMSEDQRKTTRWVIVSASYNSPLTIDIAPRPVRGRKPNPEVSKTFVRGMKALEKSAKEPPEFTPTIMFAAKKLVESTSKGGYELTISGPGGERVKATKKLVKHVDAILERKQYKEYTTIEGKLDTINIHKGFEFIVYDILTDQGTTCRFGPELYEAAHSALGRRVAVTGMATFNRQDQPTSMHIDEIEVFGDPSELPRFLAGEEINITGGVDSVDYVRRGRDVE